MTDRIEAIRARWAKATPGPWAWEPDGERGWTGLYQPVSDDVVLFGLGPINCGASDRDALAAAPEDIAYLLAVVEAARAMADHIRPPSWFCPECQELVAAYDAVVGEGG